MPRRPAMHVHNPPYLSLHRRTVGRWPARAHIHIYLFLQRSARKGAPCPKLPSTGNSQDIAQLSEVPDLRAGFTDPPLPRSFPVCSDYFATAAQSLLFALAGTRALPRLCITPIQARFARVACCPLQATWSSYAVGERPRSRSFSRPSLRRPGVRGAAWATFPS